jgi:hypothetical protein
LEQLQGLVTSLTGQQQDEQLCAALATFELGANPGSQAEGFEAMLAGLRAARPGLDVHWRVVDQCDDPAGGDVPGLAAGQQPRPQQQ